MMARKKSAVAFVLCLLAAHSAADDSLAGDFAMQVEKLAGETARETKYRIRAQDCVVEWLVRHYPAGGWGMVEQSDCALPLAAQASMRGALLDRVASETNNLSGLRNYYWGRLARRDTAGEFSQRLAGVARVEARWNGKTGTPVGTNIGTNRTVVALLNQGAVFRELVQEFSARKFNLTVSSVEKVIVARIETGRGSALVPVDCVVSFKVEKQADAVADADAASLFPRN